MGTSVKKILRFYFTSLLLLLAITLIFKVTFLVQNKTLFPDPSPSRIVMTLLWGLRFDLAVSSIFAMLPTLIAWALLRYRIQFNFGYLLVPSLVVLCTLQSADIMYFEETGRHISYEVRDGVADMGSIIQTGITRFAGTMSFGILIIAVASLFMILAHRKEKITHKPRWSLEITVLGLLLFSLISTRGGLQSAPLATIHAYQIGEPKLGVFILNGAYSAVRSGFSNKKVVRVKLPIVDRLSPDQKKSVLQSLYQDNILSSQSENDAPPYNIVMVFLESWPAAEMQSYGYDRRTTPFFDDLRGHSLTTDEMIAGGSRTTEGLFSTLCSAQNPLGKTVANSQLQDYRYICLPELLRARGWATSFFQGSHKETSGTGAFSQKLGFEWSFGKQEMPSGRFPHNYWGAQDPDLYDFVLEEIKNLQKPFFIGINTNTTHDLVLPPGIPAKFGKSDEHDLKDSVLYFADEALGSFIHQYENAQFGPTLFVLLADHTAGHQATRLDYYRIPFLIYKSGPQAIKKAKREVTAAQRDIAPTILDMLGLESPSGFLGKSLLQKADRRFADYYHSGILGWIENNRLIEISLADASLLDCLEKRQTWEKVVCTEKDEALRTDALVFTNYSQSLLFEGKLHTFKDFQKDSGVLKEQRN